MNACLINYYGVPILYTFLDMSQPSVVCLSSIRSASIGIAGVRSAGVGIAGVRSAGVGIAGVRSTGVGRRIREVHRRRASLLVSLMNGQCISH